MLDTNVILDVWLAREPYWRDAAQLVGSIERKEMEGFVCPTTITTLHYLGKKVLGEDRIRKLLANLLKIFQVGDISSQVFEQALESKIHDFEDAVIEAVSVGSGVDVIATRNTKDFKKSKIPAREPIQLRKGDQ
ncbi:MAG: PIN domain-containing protein [Verrucomicrobia bacterium]|nr:PIN domain-containing protein [Verrucomicrobiota bacterium]